MAPGKTVQELALLAGGELVGPEPELGELIADVTHDSRQTHEGCLFVAIRGERFDGHEFVTQAVEGGAPAACVTHPQESGVPEIVVENTRAVLGPLSAEVHDHPSKSMDVVGITGTNGKTTVAHHVGSIGKAAGRLSGVVGTIHTRVGEEIVQAVRTTPEASDFQRLLAHMRDQGAEVVAVEVSSHGLELGRVAATTFSVAAFTNLSQDHLDFHGDMKSYLAAKRRLFEDYDVGTAVVNIDDEAGAGIAASYRGDLMTVGRTGDIGADEITTVAGGTEFEMRTPWGSVGLVAPVVGAFNLDNVLVAAGCCLAIGIDLNDVASGIESLPGVPGRYEIVSAEDPITIVVDYAHTPQGIAMAVEAARAMTRRKVIAIIGAGGDRDREKRPLMGQAASTADLVVVTSDNPRSEDPEEIARAVMEGVPLETRVILELDRRTAIHRAIYEAVDGDIVLVLGRGHEPTQEIAGSKLPFDDREVSRRALAHRRMSADSGSISGSIG